MTKHSYYKYSIWNTCHSCIICCDSRNRDHTESSRKSSTRSPTVHCKCSDPGGVGLTHPNNLYTVFNIMDVLGHLVSSPQELMDISVKQLHQEYELATLTQIKEMVILKLLPIPQKWWVRQPHVENPCWSSMNMKFRIMNAGLGNRDAYRTANSVCQDWGRILQCPLCFQGSNNEIHLLTKCEVMVKHRQSIKLRCELSL